MNEIVEHNVLLMEDSKSGLLEFLREESFGGSAGGTSDGALGAANFYFERETGKIICFSNRISLQGTYGRAAVLALLKGNSNSLTLTVDRVHFYHATERLASDVLLASIAEFKRRNPKPFSL